MSGRLSPLSMVRAEKTNTSTAVWSNHFAETSWTTWYLDSLITLSSSGFYSIFHAMNIFRNHRHRHGLPTTAQYEYRLGLL
jgi:hypothetical protein